MALDGNYHLYKTTNSGNNWFLQYTFLNNFVDFFFASKDTGWALAGATRYMRTTNGGFNWTPFSDPYFLTGPTKIYFINNNLGVFSALSNKIVKTTNGGTLFLQNSPSSATYCIQLTDTLNGWAGGNSCIVATTDGGGPAKIRELRSEIPTEYKLFQNYPNPFNQSTVINFQFLIAGNIKIKLYDISGKEITELVNKKLNAGKYELKFDAGNLSSGVYFYSLFADDKKIDSKSLLLIK
jgi:hypothetical protein